ncbi:hypothetical protein QUF90_01765 [Desulfococcaceae bacterium HSG9]|nr:hypothetical protein [Desulfococcaceae bacterium HSG9]
MILHKYLGGIGKVDNGRGAVFGGLICDTERNLINTRLFLPECRTEDATRCDEAGMIPLNVRQGKTKPMLASDMVREDRQRGRQFEWVGGMACMGMIRNSAMGSPTTGNGICWIFISAFGIERIRRSCPVAMSGGFWLTRSRNAKQHWGLEDFMNVNERPVYKWS